MPNSPWGVAATSALTALMGTAAWTSGSVPPGGTTTVAVMSCADTYFPVLYVPATRTSLLRTEGSALGRAVRTAYRGTSGDEMPITLVVLNPGDREVPSYP
eukprot:scaffold127714_cov27-Phaeocystis_antarctica.AAC.1